MSWDPEKRGLVGTDKEENVQKSVTSAMRESAAPEHTGLDLRGFEDSIGGQLPSGSCLIKHTTSHRVTDIY